jgi:hypothetical protein
VELEKYDPASEFALGGDEEGWVATHQDPAGKAAGAAAKAAAGGGEDDIPTLEEDPPTQPAAAAAAGGSSSQPAAGRGGDDDDIPDISELELAAAEDEVSEYDRDAFEAASLVQCMVLSS